MIQAFGPHHMIIYLQNEIPLIGWNSRLSKLCSEKFTQTCSKSFYCANHTVKEVNSVWLDRTVHLELHANSAQITISGWKQGSFFCPPLWQFVDIDQTKHLQNLSAIRQLLFSFCDAFDWIEPHVITAYLSEVAVLSWSQIKHLARKVGQLKHQPVAFHHIAGPHVRHVILILNGVAVISQLMHLPFKVGSLVDPHLKGSLVLFNEILKNAYIICMNLTIVMVLFKFWLTVC